MVPIITLNDSCVTGGSLLSGTLQVTSDTPGANSAWMLTFQGHESTTEGSGDSRHTVQRQIISMEIPSAQQGHSPLGLTVYSFHTIVPHNLPPTMKIDDCLIEYQIIAVCARPTRLLREQCSQVVLVKKTSPPVLLPIPYYHSPEEEEIDFCSCFARGSMTLSAQIDSIALYNGQTATVKVACRNASTAQV